MYKLIAAISVLIRQFYLPNPFDSLEKEVIITIWEIPIVLLPDILNCLVTEPFLHAMTFAIVGMYCKSRSNPVWGSFLFLLFYCIHTVLLCLVSMTGFAIWAIALIGGLYVGCHVVLNRVRNSLVY